MASPEGQQSGEVVGFRKACPVAVNGQQVNCAVSGLGGTFSVASSKQCPAQSTKYDSMERIGVGQFGALNGLLTPFDHGACSALQSSKIDADRRSIRMCPKDRCLLGKGTRTL